MSDLRDLEADRRFVDCVDPDDFPDGCITVDELIDIALAALDEIERLKGLWVRKVFNSDGRTGFIVRLDDDRLQLFPTEADAWAAVRKAALNG